MDSKRDPDDILVTIRRYIYVAALVGDDGEFRALISATRSLDAVAIGHKMSPTPLSQKALLVLDEYEGRTLMLRGPWELCCYPDTDEHTVTPEDAANLRRCDADGRERVWVLSLRGDKQRTWTLSVVRDPAMLGLIVGARMMHGPFRIEAALV
jgi:hypothetical protein